MAAPADITIKDLSGRWIMVRHLLYVRQTPAHSPQQNKILSDDTDAVLALQGVSWWTRKAIAYSTITLTVKQYTDDNAITHIDISQVGTGGLKGTTELRELDGVQREHDDYLFGKLKGSSRWLGLDAVDDQFLKDGWLEGDEEAGGPAGERHVESSVINEEKGWTALQIWGFAILEGKRYYVRRVVVSKGETVYKVRLVYDWQAKE